MIDDAIAHETNRLVTAAEVRDALRREITAEERDDVLSLVDWFTKRYPDAEARLAYVRRAYARWTRTSPRT